jgi:nitrogen-specific signal transduction histidine kinase
MVETEEAFLLLANAPQPIHFVNEDGTILWANKAELECFGNNAQNRI